MLRGPIIGQVYNGSIKGNLVHQEIRVSIFEMWVNAQSRDTIQDALKFPQKDFCPWVKDHNGYLSASDIR